MEAGVARGSKKTSDELAGGLPAVKQVIQERNIETEEEIRKLN